MVSHVTLNGGVERCAIQSQLYNATHVSTIETAEPGRLSIILPTFNRGRFLTAAFSSIASQTFSNWELVIVDDGSVDDTKQIVERLAATLPNAVRYLHQENRGPAAARNRGVDNAVGEYIAFFDSDDLWLPTYLERAVTALEGNPDIDWVFGPCRMVDLASGNVVEPNTFYVSGHQRPFLDLNVDRRPGGINVISDVRALECQILHGLFCGPQNSVMRRWVVERSRFPEDLRVGEDQILVISALAAGQSLAYYVDPQVIYYLHDENLSNTSTVRSAERAIAKLQPLIEALNRLASELPLNRRERRALQKRLGQEYFWHLGYNGYRRTGRHKEALDMYRRGLSAWPWRPSAWKTYLLARLRVALHGVGH
jgi:glycosyltransferase involved in cell wall biosynthesis